MVENRNTQDEVGATAGADLTKNQVTNWQKWVRIGLHGILSAILLFILGLIFEIKTHPSLISFRYAWQIYGVTNPNKPAR